MNNFEFQVVSTFPIVYTIKASKSANYFTKLC